MEKGSSKRVHQTFSIPLDVSKELHTYVKRREMSQFVTEAIRKELSCRKDDLRQAYLSANDDRGQEQAMREWDSTISDGSAEW